MLILDAAFILMIFSRRKDTEHYNTAKDVNSPKIVFFFHPFGTYGAILPINVIFISFLVCCGFFFFSLSSTTGNYFIYCTNKLRVINYI